MFVTSERRGFCSALPTCPPPLGSKVLARFGENAHNLKYEDVEEYLSQVYISVCKSILNRFFSSHVYPTIFLEQCSRSIHLDCFEYEDIRFLIGQLKGKQVLSEQMNGRSLLRTAIEELRIDYVELLLLYGADPSPIFGASWAQICGEALLSRNESHFVENWEQPFQRILPWNQEAAGYAKNIRPTFKAREQAAVLDLYRIRKENRPKFAFTWLKTRHSTPNFIPEVVVRVGTDVANPSNVLPVTNYGPLESKEGCLVAWVHIFSTFGAAILPFARAIGRKIYEDKHVYTPFINSIVDFFHHSFRPTFVTRQNSFIQYRDVGYNSQSFEEQGDCRTKADIKCTAIVFPCLVIDRRSHWKKRREFYKSNKLQYPTGLMGVHLECTLDEAYYPGLNNDVLESLNNDQVIDKQHRSQVKGMLNDQERPIILVPQLWLWKADKILVSAYSMTRPTGIFVPNPNEHMTLMPQLCTESSIDLQMAYIIESYIYSFGQPYEEDGRMIFQSILDHFETALITVNIDVREYLSHRVMQDIQLEKEKGFIESISDIRNELDMIQTVIDQQHEILDKFAKDVKERKVRDYKKKQRAERLARQKRYLIEYEEMMKELHKQFYKDECYEDEHHGYDYEEEEEHDDVAKALLVLKRGKEQLSMYSKRINTLNRDAEKISKTIDDRLNLSRVDASIREAKSSVSIGYVALAFAIVTIVFVPLNFVASLMALPGKHFVDLQYKYNDLVGDDTRVYKTGYLEGIFVGVELISLLITGGITFLVYCYAPWSGSKARGKMIRSKNSCGEMQFQQASRKEFRPNWQDLQTTCQTQTKREVLYRKVMKLKTKDCGINNVLHEQKETSARPQEGSEVV